MSEIYSKTLLPDVDGTVIAAGPVVTEKGMMPSRTVLRKLKDGHYVIHNQAYPNLNRGDDKPQRDYSSGDYCGSEDQNAFAQFVCRLIKQGKNQFGLTTNDMVPNGIFLPMGQEISESGNTLLTDDENNVYAVLNLGGNLRLEVFINWNNYPVMRVTPLVITEENLANFINETCDGWKAIRLNVEGVNIVQSGESWYVQKK